MSSDREILISALETALRAWKASRASKALLGYFAVDESILSPLAAAISQCEAFKAVAGHVLFSANSGPVLTEAIVALPLLFKADQTPENGQAVGRAADWLIRMLRTREATGRLTAVIWGLSIDKEVKLAGDAHLLPFSQLPESRLKKWISDRAQDIWDSSAWISERYFDLPSAALVKKVADFPYIRTDNASFLKISDLERQTYETLIVLQGKVVGRPLALGYWFAYDDEELDLKSHENFVSWILPEVLPHIEANLSIDAASVKRDLDILSAMQADWRNDLIRSMERFALSQCRRQLIDRILDLALAFEIAVRGEGEQLPISWKVSVRTAQMIGGSLVDRLENRKMMSAFYRLRSKGTHGSSLSGAEITKQETILTDAVVLYRKLFASFWNHKARPDWNAVELGPT